MDKERRRLLVEPRKPSPSSSRTEKSLAEVEAGDADEGESLELMLAQNSLPVPDSGYLP